jgi:serine phosphatase RsbU (regulator of sigma subunit)
MFELSDFFHLSQVDDFIDQIASGGPGLIVVAGPDARPAPALSARGGFLSSGRSAIFQILLEKSLARRPGEKCIVIAVDKGTERAPRSLKGRVTFSRVEEDFSYEERIAAAISYRPGLIAIDLLKPANIRMALRAAGQGLPVLAQVETVCWGPAVIRHLLDLGATAEGLENLAWVVTVQRLEKLCPHCKQAYTPDPGLLERVGQQYPELVGTGQIDLAAVGELHRPTGCSQCQGAGRQGDVALFDIFRAEPGDMWQIARQKRLSLEVYLWQLVTHGYLALEDMLDYRVEQLHRTFQLLLEREQELKTASAAFGRKLAELEVANRVLEQRTQSLISLQEIGQALITTQDLRELAVRVLRRARELCGADRAVLYYLHTPEEAEVLAVGGWETISIGQKLDRRQVFLLGSISEPAPFNRLPPGAAPSAPGESGPDLKSGLYVPLIARGRLAGLMIVHSTQKPSFKQAEVALLKGFANQAALAIERAGLVEQLQAKITQLEAAQAGLAVKERMERELELAREVQQSVLPTAFPPQPGYCFAAQNIPARQVGGDFYDVIALDEEHFGVAIADVSDKGMPAALYMALTRSLLLAEARRAQPPRAARQALLSVNRLLQEIGQPKLFVTLFYGVIARSTGLLTYASAGHDRPALLRAGGASFLKSQGGPLGILDSADLHLSEETLQLEAGDRLALYTDGLVDLMAPDGRTYGRRRLMELFRENARLPAEKLCTEIFSHLHAYQGGAVQYDDMALLIVEVEN